LFTGWVVPRVFIVSWRQSVTNTIGLLYDMHWHGCYGRTSRGRDLLLACLRAWASSVTFPRPGRPGLRVCRLVPGAAEVAYAPGLDRMLNAGARYSGVHAEYVIEQHPLGEVTFPTGRVVGCDPLAYSAGAPPFAVAVPPGRYRVRAWVAVLYRGDAEYQRRVAALQLIIRDEPAARWQPALVEGQDLAALGEGGYFGYPVDAGTGTLADLAAVRALATWDYQRLEDAYIPARLPERPVPGAAGAVTDEQSGANVIIVASGLGDGQYPTFIGYTATDAVSSFVTDFLVISEGCVLRAGISGPGHITVARAPLAILLVWNAGRVWVLDPANSRDLIGRLRPHGRDCDFEIASVGEGWRPLVGECHKRLEAAFPDYELLDIKQKWGVLVYQAFPRRWVEGSKQWTMQEYADLGAIVGEIQERSAAICEWCGAAGQPREWRNLELTLCDACDQRFPDLPCPVHALRLLRPNGTARAVDSYDAKKTWGACRTSQVEPGTSS
jgi:hypothetical protein